MISIALLSLGPGSERRVSKLEPSLCANAGYRRMRAGRMLLAGFADAADMLARECQAHPDFSGVWKPVDAETPSAPTTRKPDGPPPPPKTLLATITQSSTAMRLDRRVETGGREAVYTFVYRLDGTESLNQMGPLIFRTKASWSEGRLTLGSVISIEEKAVGELTEVDRFDGADLIVESDRKVPAGAFRDKDV